MGHSAGGQLTHRYACLSDLESSGKNVNYIVSNPSSYVYIRQERWDENTQSYIVPSNSSNCPDFNNYYYGIQNINNVYNPNLSISDIQTTFPFKNVIYLTGSDDNGNSDSSCEANYQGSSRKDRATKMNSFMSNFYPTTNHYQIMVNGVGHNADLMFNSSECISLLTTILE